MGYLEVIVFVVALIQISRNKMAFPLTAILFLSQAYSFCGSNLSTLFFSHQYADTGLVLYIFMLIVMFLHKPQKLDMRLLHPVKVGILLFLGSSQDEFGNISKELEAELAKNTLFLLSEASNEKAD